MPFSMRAGTTVDCLQENPRALPQSSRHAPAETDLVRVFIIGHQRSVAEAYAHRLQAEEGFLFLGASDNAETIPQILQNLRPDVCAIDLLLGERSASIRALRAIQNANPETKRLLIIDGIRHSTALLAEALQEKPQGIFVTNEGLEELVRCIWSLSKGKEHFSSLLPPLENTAEAITSLFSPGEFRVACALARHGNKSDVAASTFYSVETVNTYIRRIRKRVADFEDKSTLRLPGFVAWAREHGFHLVDRETSL